MKASLSAPVAPPVDVAFPSTKPPVNRHKLATRDAVQRLRDAGVEPRQSHYGHPAVFSLVKHAPELLEKVIEAVHESSEQEKLLWQIAISDHLFTMDADSVTYSFNLYFEIVPLAREKMQVRVGLFPGEATSAFRGVQNTVRNLRSFRPGADNITALVRGYDLYAEIQSRVSGSFIDRRMKRINSATIDDIAFIAENLEAVRGLLPVLKERAITDRGLIGAMLEAGSKPLLGGVL